MSSAAAVGGDGGGSCELKLSSPPTDGITSVQFSPSSSRHLLASSWDSNVRVYDVHNNRQVTQYEHSAAVLGACYQDDEHACSGGMDNAVKLCDLSAGVDTVLGQHGAPVRCVQWSDECRVLASGGWDCQLCVWDLRQRRQAGTHAQPDRVYALSVGGQRVVVATAGRKVLVWDLRHMAQPQQRKDSSLKYQTRCVRCFADRQGYVLGSIEGRVAVEYFDTSAEWQKRRYAFKCHRLKEAGGMELVHPVNAVDFHRQHNTFATGGSDGFVNVWDGVNKKRLCQLRRYPTSVAALAFSCDGAWLAIAASYQFEQKQHPQPLPDDNIFVRRVTDQEVKPK